MTNWSELEDLGLTEESDEFDPLAPMPVSGDDVDDEESEWDPSPRVAQDGTFNLDAPFGDPQGVVRVWIDDTKTITKVRISPSWREKLGDRSGRKATAAALVQAFHVAFVGINNFDQGHRGQGQTVFGEDESVVASHPIGWDDLARLGAASDEVHEKFQALAPDEGHGTWSGTGAVGHGGGGKVTIVLDREGNYEDLTLDEKWVDESRVKQVSDAVVAASAQAKAQETELTYTPGLRDELMAQNKAIRSELAALMKRGFH